MVINLRRRRRVRADTHGRTWWVGSYRRDTVAARRYRCFLNGKEVTHDTFYVDTRRGVIRMMLRNENGQHYVDRATGEVATVEKRGYVKLRRQQVAA